MLEELHHNGALTLHANQLLYHYMSWKKTKGADRVIYSMMLGFVCTFISDFKLETVQWFWGKVKTVITKVNLYILTAEDELASASSLFFLAACSRKALALFFLAGVVVGTPELSSCALLDLWKVCGDLITVRCVVKGLRRSSVLCSRKVTKRCNMYGRWFEAWRCV